MVMSAATGEREREAACHDRKKKSVWAERETQWHRRRDVRPVRQRHRRHLIRLSLVYPPFPSFSLNSLLLFLLLEKENNSSLIYSTPVPTQHASDMETLPPPMLLLLFIPVALLLAYILHLRFRTDLSTLADIFAFAFRRSREPKRPAHSARLLLSNRKRESTLILKVKLEK
jgi:hypothetical protein